MIRKPKNGGEDAAQQAEAAKRKEQAAQEADAASCAKAEPQPGETEQAGEAQAEAAQAEAAQADTPGTDEKTKQPSDLDILKAYLAQTIEELKKTKQENDELRTRGQRLDSQADSLRGKLESVVAEYDNFRRRTAEEKEALSGEEKAKAVAALLPALDNLERAMPYAASNPESFEKGVEMTLRQMTETFRTLGVTEIEAQGAEFNPELHEAVMHVEDENVGEGIVTEVFQKGYMLGKKVIRHSVVKVAN